MNSNTNGFNNSLVIVVDDDPDVLRFIRRVLEKHFPSYDIMEFDDGLKVIDVLIDGNPKLMILDINLPCFGGLELCRLVRKWPRLNRMPILAITGLLTHKIEDTMLRQGASEFLRKPFDQNELARTIERLLV